LANVLAVWLLGNKNYIGFLVRMAANLAWIFLGFIIQSLPLILAAIIFFILIGRGFYKWKTDGKKISQ
jgi:ABC-type multidrug transport system permease subunit